MEEDYILVYIAKRLKEALAIEALFKESGLDYVVEPDTYAGGVIFRSQRTGAFFYVDPENQTVARDLLERSGYTPLS
jgi:hypothetical protein